ncbi:hypothetical protein BKI52_35670 [marine bacterium AO1-C]|nr:hypothetical protein BKI52_35670 [marine bacterium AO1-C]
MNNWTVLTKEEMLYIQGGMVEEDPAAFALANPDEFADTLEETSHADMMHWFEEYGYTRRQARRFLRRFRRWMRRRGGC